MGLDSGVEGDPTTSSHTSALSLERPHTPIIVIGTSTPPHNPTHPIIFPPSHASVIHTSCDWSTPTLPYQCPPPHFVIEREKQL